MKLLDMTCPHCGSALKIDPSNKNAICEYCGATLIIDDEVQHVQYDNAEEAGYKFEKGRQRAKNEINHKDPVDTKQNRQAPKKRKTWLWVLGWICIFPIPLTILMLRNKNMKTGLKYGSIAAAWIVYLLIAVVGGSSGNGSETTVGESAQKENGDVQKIEAQTVTETKAESVGEDANYSDDSVINRFITEFNNSYDDDIHDISKGNIHTKYYGYVRDTRLEMINANGNVEDAFCISVYGGNEVSDRDAMFAALIEIAKVLEPSLSDDTLKAAVEELIAGDALTDDYPIGDTLTVTYVPIKELSNGKNSCRVDISASNYR